MTDHRPDDTFTVGVDYGTESARALVVRVRDGLELGTAVHPYRHGVIDRTLPGTDVALPPEWALQDPEDYLEVLRVAVPAAVRASGVDPERIVGIGIDFTACTILPALATCSPVATSTSSARPDSVP